ncbi:uncharacterized protein LOC125314302 [Rhodamnia argentea]|uniref:Uncharacterized protein LOC125314302 n=1 Tax=Rhodamnia argentea TaxID=178133 RepID=A0ABM3H6J5_9MYRT|nr:uncharacterized protein LOC125314302 [Rhodamnia argentea]
MWTSTGIITIVLAEGKSESHMQQEIVQSKKISMAGTSLANAALSVLGGWPYGKHMDKNTNNQSSFQMLLHYPRYKKKDCKNMPEWKLDCLLNEYGLPVSGDVNHKRKFAMGAFLWPSQEE